MLRPAPYHARLPVLLYTKYVFRRLRIPADGLLVLRPPIRNVQNPWTVLHEIIVAPFNFPSSLSNIIANLRYCLCSHPCTAHAQHVGPVAGARTGLTTTWAHLQAVKIKLIFELFWILCAKIVSLIPEIDCALCIPATGLQLGITIIN